MKPVILITGAQGQLGSELQALAPQFDSYEWIATDAASLDITSSAALNDFFASHKITHIINCAAYTQVDRAEQEPERAALVNDQAVANLVHVAQKHGCKLIHVSTDYVFDGTNHRPLLETDPTSPLGVYGKTKRASELHMLDAGIDYAIIRTSWLYSQYQQNFVKTIQRLGAERDTLTIIADQVGTPTYAADLAQAIMAILPQLSASTSGVYHYANEGVASWYDFATAIVQGFNLSCAVLPIETKDYKTPAQRPYYSVLNKSKIKQVFNITIDHWQVALHRCLKRMSDDKQMG